MMKPWLHAAGMFVLGAASLLAVGMSFTARINAPLPVMTATATATNGTATAFARDSDAASDVLTPVFRGMQTTLASASEALTSGGSDAAPMLDAAWRVSQVVDFAAPSDEAEMLRGEIEQARRRLQNGDRAAAIRRISAAESVAASAATDAPLTTTTLDRRYVNAIVLDAEGNRLGTIRRIGDQQVDVEAPSVRNVLGFLTLTHGADRALPRSALLPGEPKTIGNTLVVCSGKACL